MSHAAKERIGRILQMHANQRVELETAHAGDIVALVGIKEIGTGDTLATKKMPLFLKISFLKLLFLAIEPKTKPTEQN